jgi:hypothetical protein
MENTSAKTVRGSVKHRILIMLCNATALRYFRGLIQSLQNESAYEVLLLARYKEIEDMARSTFTDLNIYCGYRKEMVDYLNPDLILCYQIWWWEITPLLEKAKLKNIPILHYEHGSLIYMSEFLTEGDENGSTYRADLSLCSHIACWGQRGKDCWLSYGVLEEKLFVTGAIHLDSMYSKTYEAKSDVCRKLGMDAHKSILLFYSALTGKDLSIDKASINTIQNLEQFVAENGDYQLVVKPHPTEMMFYDKPIYPYSQNTFVISHKFEDCRWENILRTDVDQVLYHCSVCICSTSSALIPPIVLNKPVIHMEFDTEASRSFSRYCRGSLWNMKEPSELHSAINSIAADKSVHSSGLASHFNYNHDGKATEWFIKLIDEIINQKLSGRSFYLDSESEFLECVKRYPFLPNPYHHLIVHYLKLHDKDNFVEWLTNYNQKFDNACFILCELINHYFNNYGQESEGAEYLVLFNRSAPIEKLIQRNDIQYDILQTILKSKSNMIIQTLFRQGMSFLSAGDTINARAYFNTLEMICRIAGIHIDNIQELYERCNHL